MRTRLALGAFGVLLMVYGTWGAFTDPGSVLWGQARFLAEVLIGHDFVLLPIGLGVGALTARLLPPGARRVTQGALWASAVVTLIAVPLIVGGGPTLPGLLVVLAAVWLAAAGIGLIGFLRRRSSA